MKEKYRGLNASGQEFFCYASSPFQAKQLLVRRMLKEHGRFQLTELKVQSNTTKVWRTLVIPM